MQSNTFYVGVNDHEIDLFEGMYHVPNGVSYNSYVVCGEKSAVFDTVDSRFASEWLGNIDRVLDGREPDYLIVLHMEPDHSGSIADFVKRYPHAKLVGNQKTFVMLGEYFEETLSLEFDAKKVTVKDGESLDLGGRVLTFVFAPMVHWPEVMVAYDAAEKTLFSADAFGKFGALDREEPWDDEARRYYIGIVGKYGVQVSAALKKLGALDIECIRSLHGPVLSGDAIAHALDLYGKWASYTPEDDVIMIAYTSVYGHTKAAAELLRDELIARKCKAEIYDLARTDWAECVAQAFKHGKIVLATTTYNADVYPAMREFIDHLVERNFQNRAVGLIHNGTWAPVAANGIKAKLEKCKGITYIGEPVKILASLNDESRKAIRELADELAK